MRRRCTRTFFLVALAQLTWALPARGQVGSIAGAVVDSATRAPLPGAQVTALDAANEVAATAVTDGRGRFRLGGLAPASYALVVRRLGYASRSVEGVVPAASGTLLEIALPPREVALDPVQVTASRAPETTLDAPVSVSVVSRREIAEAMAFTPTDHVRVLPGMDYASKGLIQNTFGVRGPRGGNQGVLLMMADHRNAALPSIGFNVSYLLPQTNEDIERIEVVRGPGAALYGPDAHRGVVHIVSRSPFESRGAALSLAGGERSVLQATARFAAAPSSRLAFKVSGDYFQGRDWEFPVATESLRRDREVRRAAGEARLDWRLDDSTTVIGAVGVAQAINVLDQSGVGAMQLRDWRYSFAQARLHRGPLFANVIYNLSDAGRTFLLRQGTPIVDNSRLIAAQLQHGADAGRVALLYGVDGRWTDPRTGGTVHGSNEDDDLVVEVGGYLQARAALSPRVDFVTAIRVDRNNRLNDLSVSPRAGLVFRPAEAHTVRLTYNRAFSSPDPVQLFQDIVLNPLPGDLPALVRNSSIPKGGFSFPRACGGLCMRSSFNPAGPEGYLPADATLLWDSVTAIMGRRGFDLSGIPAPDRSQVATNLGAWNQAVWNQSRRSVFEPVTADQITDFEPLRRTFTQTLELGYKGALGGELLVTADAYVIHVRDPFGARFAATPNVFYDSTTLAGYLSAFRSPDSAARYAGEIARIPIGTISPQEAIYPFDVLLLQRQGGSYSLWGADVSLTATISPQLTVSGAYSWISRNVIPDVPVVGTVLLTVPENKGSVTLRYRDGRSGLRAAVQGRAIGDFRTRTAVAADHIAAYAVADLHLGYHLSRADVSVSLDAHNVLGPRHRESFLAGTIGRLLVSKVQVRF